LKVLVSVKKEQQTSTFYIQEKEYVCLISFL